MNEVIMNETKIENLIYEIRGKQVMLDSDLARLYECKNGTKDINKAVKRNIERFPETFMFQLTDLEYNDLRFQTGTSKDKGGRRYNPYVFTEQGVAMLTSVIHTEIAVKMSIRIINAFVVMKKYISSSLSEQNFIKSMVLENQERIKKLEILFGKLEEKKKTNEIYFNGQIYDAYLKVLQIFKEAKEKLIIIDAYADNVVLDIIRRLNIKVTIITKKDNLLTSQDIKKYNKQYNNLKIIYNNTYHDRYFILDNEIVYHCGTSINRIGYKTFSITLLGDKDISKSLIDKVNNII